MNNENFKWKWRSLSEEALAEVVEWKQQYPWATFQEVEAVINESLRKLQMQFLHDTAHMSLDASGSQDSEESRKSCQQCGRPVILRGGGRSQVQPGGGRDLKMDISYGTCPSCGARFFSPR